MSWIGGILGKTSTEPSELRKEATIMMQTACPINKCSTAAYPWSIVSIIENGSGGALAQVSLPIEGQFLAYPHPDCQGHLILLHDGHLYNPQAIASNFPHNHQAATKTNAESLIQLLEELPGSLEQKVREVLTDLDGDFALATSDAYQTVISRNCLGTKPLYFAEDDKFFAFASNKKPLWKIGLDNVMPLRAGKLAIFNHEGVNIEDALLFDKGETDVKEMVQAVSRYQETLCSAVKKRLDEVSHVGKVGVLLSGGVDSCLLAKLVCDVASESGTKVIAYTAGFSDSPDMSFTQEFAREMGIEHKVRLLSLDEVEKYIPRVIETVEDSDFVQVEAGIGIYAAMDMATQDGIGVLFSGQGPDELWGGYNWYPEVLSQDGRQELCRRMWDDFSRADIETLDRENKIAMAHGAEMFFPYLDTEVVNVAMSVTSELKVTSEDDHLGKHPHRQLAIRIGIPDKYANRNKDAAQHGTGIHNVLDEIAKKNGFNPDLVEDIGYESDKITTAKMGSSSRYGYRYDEKKIWQVPQHVQFFLHTLAYKKGLLNKSIRRRIGSFLSKMKDSPGVHRNT